MKIKTDQEADVNITSLIDCLMQCIIFFMVIMSAQYIFGIAIKFSPAGGKSNKQQQEEKNMVVYVQADWLEKNHRMIREGILKLNGEEIPLSVSEDTTKWQAEREKAYNYLEYKISEYIKQGYKKDVLFIQGDMTAYHGKIMAVIDKGKAQGIEGFALNYATK